MQRKARLNQTRVPPSGSQDYPALASPPSARQSRIDSTACWMTIRRFSSWTETWLEAASTKISALHRKTELRTSDVSQKSPNYLRWPAKFALSPSSLRSVKIGIMPERSISSLIFLSSSVTLPRHSRSAKSVMSRDFTRKRETESLRILQVLANHTKNQRIQTWKSKRAVTLSTNALSKF